MESTALHISMVWGPSAPKMFGTLGTSIAFDLESYTTKVCTVTCVERDVFLAVSHTTYQGAGSHGSQMLV